MEPNNETLHQQSLDPAQPLDQEQPLDQRELQLFLQVKKELSIPTAQETIKLVASVLRTLRQTLTLPNADLLINKLPDFLKLIFVSDWKQNEKQIEVNHLDEFVSLVIERDKENKKNLFKDEVHALAVVILTLKKLYKIIGLENFEGLSSSLRQELQEIPSEAAA